MRRLAIALAMLAECACAPSSERTLEATRDEVTLALRRGELAQARLLAERGIALTRSQSDSPWAWAFRFLEGESLILQSQSKDALAIVSRSLPDGTRYDTLRARQRYLQARILEAQGRFPEALNILDQARQRPPSDRDTEFDIETLSGQIRMRLGHWADAESTLNSVVSRAGAVGDRFHQIWALNDLGMGRFSRKRFDEALPLFERALSFAGLEQYTIYAAALNNAGMCYSRLGEFERAVSTQRRAVQINERKGPRLYLEEALGQLGDSYVLQGDSRVGVVFLRQALDVATNSTLLGNATAAADAAKWAGNLAAAYSDLGEWDEAERFNDEATRLKIAKHNGNLVHNTLNGAQIAAGRKQFDNATRLFNEALTGSQGEPSVAWEAHAGLANVAIAQKQPDRAARQFESALDVIEKTRSDLLQTDYKLSFLTRLIQFYQAYVDALMDQGQIERALEVADSSRGRVLAERQGATPPARVSAATLRSVAKQSGTAWLAYWLGPVRSYVWVVSASGIRCLRLPAAKEIETLVREHQSAIANVLADPLAAQGTSGDKLYHLLVGPVSPWLPKNASIVIVPDGPLNGLNFETLPVDALRRHYWIEDAEIQIAPSLASLASLPPPTFAAPSMLLIGNPAPRPPEFPALGYAPTEMANVARHFGSGHVRTFEGARASPAAYRDAHPDQYAFVHFTAHATANVESPLDSAVILSGPDSGYKLYARDVAEQALHAELVTVSACRSAGGRAYSGEGLVGFSWAFLRAGARRVIAGLWDVDDRSTATLMDHIYAGLTAGDSPARSLRNAKLALIQEGGLLAKPYYWAPFELFTVVVDRTR